MTAAAVIAALLLAYTYLGYPAAIGALARLAGRRARRASTDDLGALGGDGVGDGTPLVSVCLPVFNGARYLPAKIQSLLAQEYPPNRLEILVYCDGCDDDSEAVARVLAASPESGGRIRVLAERERRGKPAAINAVAAAATGDLLLLNDVRQPLSPNVVADLARALRDPDVGCATGSLVLTGAAVSGVYWRYEAWIRRQESRFRGVVGMTGAIAMMRRADHQPLPDDVILDDVWIPMRLGLRGKRVEFVAEAEAYDTAFEDEHEFRRKVRTLAGNFQLFARIPALLIPFANPIWFETISHKVLRLLGPWLMLALAVATASSALSAGAPSHQLMRGLVVAQAAFYGAAALGRRGGRLAGVARTFVVLNLAAAVGLWRFLRGQQRITW